MAHSVKALVFIDAVHYAPHILADVRALDCDFLSLSAYKAYGPHVGILYGKQGLLEDLDFPKLEPAPESAPERVETGTQNHEGIVGAGAAVNYLASLSAGTDRREQLKRTYASLHARGKILVGRLWEGLSGIEGVTLYGPPPESTRTPTVSFTVRGVPSTIAARKLADVGIFLSHGDFYAATVVERLGLADEGLLRAGCACYTTTEEIERLIAGVCALAREG
jgi:selenocysteine lyase/cysteine desulfurase